MSNQSPIDFNQLVADFNTQYNTPGSEIVLVGSGEGPVLHVWVTSTAAKARLPKDFNGIPVKGEVSGPVTLH